MFLQILAYYMHLESDPSQLLQTVHSTVDCLNSKTLDFHLRRYFIEDHFLPYLEQHKDTLTTDEMLLAIDLDVKLGDAALSQSDVMD